MKRIFLVVACIGALFLSGCGGDSKLPTATGKGAVRVINAIPDSAEIAFLIEERLIGTVKYKGSTGRDRYDDFEYSFNFEVRYPGDATNTRVATQAHKVERDRGHIFVLTGDINAPTITLWNGDLREWAETETVFEARFSHASVSLGDIDIYFDEPGIALGTNPPVATLSYREIVDAADFAEGSYVLTVTAAGDLNTVYYSSFDVPLVARFAHLFTVFDGDGNNTAPFTVRSLVANGNVLELPDAAYPPETRFIHSAYTLETVDVYDDELLTNLFVDDLQFGATTPNLETSLVDKTYYFTPADSVATVLFERVHGAQDAGTYADIYLIGDTDDWLTIRVRPERAVSSISARLRIFNAALNQASFDVYRKNRGEPLVEDDLPILLATYPFYTSISEFVAGSYDIYLTERGTKTEVSAPYAIDVSLGDIVDLVAVDTVDPAIIELLTVPAP